MQHQPRTSRLAVGTAASAGGPGDGPADATGTLLGGRYRVGECIGAGAMGVVWTAYDRRLRRTVAVKQLVRHSRGAQEPGEAQLARARALREGRIAARVVHARAIAVFDVIDHAGTPWLVMEYLRSRSLAAVLAEQGPLDPGAAAAVGAQIADALSAVHAAGIVHGDVKPGNVLLADDGVAKLTDFGVSRASWDSTATGGGEVAGTPGYFAPEVARGEEPTPASDVFSLGATLYAAVENELVCGRSDNTLATLHAMAEGRLRPAVRAGTLGRPLAAMLRRDPGHRPDMAAVRRALRARATTFRPGSAVPPVPTPAAPAAPADEAPPAPASPVVPMIPRPREEIGAEPAPGHTEHPRTRIDGRRALALGAAVAVVIGVAAGATAATVGGGTDGGDGGSPPAVTAGPVTAPAPGVAPEGFGAAGVPVSGSEAVDTVAAYYAVLPGDVDGAWARLSPGARADANGLGVYRRFWSGIRSVSASGVTAENGEVRAVITFVTVDGQPSREPYRFEVGRGDDGRLLITSARRGGDET